jgi:hypothetical protein
MLIRFESMPLDQEMEKGNQVSVSGLEIGPNSVVHLFYVPYRSQHG